MGALERYEDARLQVTQLRVELKYRRWWQYVFQPLKTLELVQQYLDSDSIAWLRMQEYMTQLAAERKPTKDPDNG